MIMYTLCNQKLSGSKLSRTVIEDAVRPVWPAKNPITKQNIFYIRMRVAKLLALCRSARDFEDFRAQANITELQGGIDNEFELDDDEAYAMAQEVCATITGGHDYKDSLFSILDYLELIAQHAKGFSFEKSTSTDSITNSKKELLGICWMTATMRRNYELYGDYLCFDMMMRVITTLAWPYTSVALHDEHHKICLALEGFACGEKLDLYAAKIKFLERHAPRRSLDSISIVSADGIMDQSSMETIGLPNAHFIADRWHLVDSGLEKLFGKMTHNLIKEHLRRMMNASNESEFDDMVSMAKSLLENEHGVDGEALQNLKDFVDRRDSYALYVLRRIPSNRY